VLDTYSPFLISIQFDNRWHKYVVQHRRTSATEETFTVIARNGTLKFSSNRPLFRGKGLRHRRPDYKLIEGSLWNRSILEKIIEAIDEKVNR
jgi:hypothetical protein